MQSGPNGVASLQENTTFPACLRVVFEDAGSEHLKETKKGEGGMTKYYVYPDGTITEEPLDFMSDDYFIIQAEDYDEAYETALMMGLI